MSFRIKGLPAENFSHLFSLDDAALANLGAVRRVAEHPAPCRVSLTDAEPGDEVILVHFEHQTAATPYRASHAIYVRRGERQFDAVDEVPHALRLRLLSVRGFDAAGMMTNADVVDGRTLTSWPSLQTDLRNAGAEWVDEEVVVDTDGPGPLISSRKPDDLPAFTKAMADFF